MTGAMKHSKNPERQTANRGHKWKNFIRPIGRNMCKNQSKK